MLDDIFWQINSASRKELLVLTSTNAPGKIYGTDYPWAKFIRVRCIGAGGGSGGCASGVGATTNMHSAGGGGGGYSEIFIPYSEIGYAANISIGTGGLGGAAGFNNGSAGGSTAFDFGSSTFPSCVATGGGGGEGAQTSGSTNFHYDGGAGGNVSGGSGHVVVTGSDGGTGYTMVGNTGPFGHGGASGLNYGGLRGRSAAANNDGRVGQSYGGGAKGVYRAAGQAAVAGAAGADGLMIIEVYG